MNSLKVKLTPLALAVFCFSTLSTASPVTTDSTEVATDSTEVATDSTEVATELPPPQVASNINTETTRTYDGSMNNKKHPNYGKAGNNLRRLHGLPARYGHGGFEPIDYYKSAREISNILIDQDSSDTELGTTSMHWAFGQFLDHDLDFTPSFASSQLAEDSDERIVITNIGDEQRLETITSTAPYLSRALAILQITPENSKTC